MQVGFLYRLKYFSVDFVFFSLKVIKKPPCLNLKISLVILGGHIHLDSFFINKNINRVGREGFFMLPMCINVL